MREKTVSVDEEVNIQDTQAGARVPVIRYWEHISLGGILLLAIWLNFFQLNQEGYANTYYAATVKSMLTSWHAFFFVSFDAGGFVSVDKPPLGLWLQAISAKIFGFSGFSLLLPQALAGVLAVALLYYLVKRHFGGVAGLLAALALALTPISVVTNRNNTMDSLLVLALLCGAWALCIGTERGRLRWLLLCAICVGLGFNIKMLQAYLVVLPFWLTYALGAPVRKRTRTWHLALATLVMLVVSLSWTTIVDLTPVTQRPFVGSSGANNELSLILGYNGLGRLTEAFGGLGLLNLLHINIDISSMPGFSPGIGDPGALRLVSSELGPQASWLLPLAVVGLLVAVWQLPRRLPLGREGIGLVLWGGWLVTVGIYFSVSRFFHQYYLVMLAPGIAAMVGIGLVALWRMYRADEGITWRRWLLPAALVLSMFVQTTMLSGLGSWNDWLTLLCILFFVLLAVLLLRLPKLEWRRIPVAPVVSGVALAALLCAPTYWNVVSLANGNGGSWIPQAGPSMMGFGGMNFSMGANGMPNFPGGQGQNNGQSPFPGGSNQGNGQNTLPGGANQGSGQGAFPGGSGQNTGMPGGGFPGGEGGFGGGISMTIAGPDWNVLDTRLVTYLQQEQRDTRYLVATMTSSYASIFILATDQPALALGGYQGWDRIVDPQQLAKMVNENTVRFFYIPANEGSGQSSTMPTMPGMGGNMGNMMQEANTNSDLASWVHTSCQAVPENLWKTAGGQTNTSNPMMMMGGALSLYDCARK